MGEKLTRLRKFFRFTNEELKNLVILVVAFSIILGFDDGNETFNAASWVINWIGCLVIVMIAFLAHIGTQKVWGLFNGVRIEQQISWYGIGIGLIAALLSKGGFGVYLPGTFKPFHMSHARLGDWRHGLNPDLVGYIALAGPIANIVLAMASKWILFQLLGIESLWVDKFIMFNFMLAFFTMLPLPGQSGLTVFFGSRLWYVIGFGTIMGYVILFMMGILSLFGALAVGVVVWLIYYIFFERLAW
jgi:hypothetical protein